MTPCSVLPNRLDSCIRVFLQGCVKGWQFVFGGSVKCCVICSWHQFCHQMEEEWDPLQDVMACLKLLSCFQLFMEFHTGCSCHHQGPHSGYPDPLSVLVTVSCCICMCWNQQPYSCVGAWYMAWNHVSLGAGGFNSLPVPAWHFAVNVTDRLPFDTSLMTLFLVSLANSRAVHCVKIQHILLSPPADTKSTPHNGRMHVLWYFGYGSQIGGDTPFQLSPKSHRLLLCTSCLSDSLSFYILQSADG